MQLLPAEWALYGRGGNINSQHDARRVVYQSTGGLVILPSGYPTLRPVPVS